MEAKCERPVYCAFSVHVKNQVVEISVAHHYSETLAIFIIIVSVKCPKSPTSRSSIANIVMQTGYVAQHVSRNEP